MTSHKADELQSDGKDSLSVTGQLFRPGPDGVAEEVQPDPVNTAAKSPKTWKLRRTALTFFGVRRSICILPSFFGGRIKNQSKKGICRSKTHDGLSKVSHDDSPRGGYVSAGDLEYHGQRDAAGERHSSCHSECSHPATDQNSLTLGRQRKGFRSLFQSFKQHRSQRNAEPDKTTESSPQCKKEVPVVQHNTDLYATKCLGSEPDVPDLADVTCSVSIGLECSREDAVVLENCAERESAKSALDDQLEDVNLKAGVSSKYEETSRRSSEPCLKLQVASEPALKPQTSASSSDRLNLIFGDVASLKSFDSLTGCGDIIADQEDDSFTESTVSGERSRNGGKRASCYLTYQGGGEEMASPEDLDDTTLRDFWGNNTSEEVCCACDPEQADVTAELTSSHNMDVLNSSSAQQAGGMDSSSIADVLTPPSEHQESVPNSDEGYYDSTTPGPDEGQEKSDRLRAASLPRDSYSGDALYELFAPDESLISPHYENKSQHPGSKHCNYLTEPVGATEPAFVPEMSRLQISAEFVNNINQDVFTEKGNVLASTEKIKSVNIECEKRRRSLSFGSTSDPDFETFCEPKEEHLEENKPVALPYKNINSQSEDSNSYVEDGQTVCFSQALVDYTKHAQMLSDSETSSALTPNMEALPAIVTFDVVDLHNEGEYDEQIHMELEEDTSLPFQEFEESYLQKDAFAECDYQMLELYEQNLISNTWAVASLPRHLGLTRVSQSALNPLSLDRRSRSLDTESLEAYRENRAAMVSRPQTEEYSERDRSPYYQKNVVLPASEAGDARSITAVAWQTGSEVALSRPLTDGETTDKVQSLGQPQAEPKLFPCSSNRNFLKLKSPRHRSDPSDSLSYLVSQNTELYGRQCRLPLPTDSCLPQSSLVYSGVMEGESDISGVFYEASASLQSCNQGRALAGREGASYGRSPLSAAKDETLDAMIPVACSEHTKATCN
uniref:APC membrane recruitment protein 1 n=1 Tax=Kryptolebias marmoratus TaxID=37003 RepID=A0A3Q3A6G7_KRYMA